MKKFYEIFNFPLHLRTELYGAILDKAVPQQGKASRATIQNSSSASKKNLPNILNVY